MKQCAGDSSESRKCLNLSSSSRTPAVKGVGGLVGWGGGRVVCGRAGLVSGR